MKLGMAHPMGPAAGVTALQQAWGAAVDGLSLEKAAGIYPEFAKSVEKSHTLMPPTAFISVHSLQDFHVTHLGGILGPAGLILIV